MVVMADVADLLTIVVTVIVMVTGRDTNKNGSNCDCGRAPMVMVMVIGVMMMGTAAGTMVVAYEATISHHDDISNGTAYHQQQQQQNSDEVCHQEKNGVSKASFSLTHQKRHDSNVNGAMVPLVQFKSRETAAAVATAD